MLMRRDDDYGVTLLMRVDQLPSAPRVLPQVGSARYVAYVQVCATYSEAIQIELPSDCGRTIVAPARTAGAEDHVTA